MPHSKSFVESIVSDAFRRLGAGRPVPNVDVKFYPYSGSHHTIRIRAGCAYLRISDIFSDAPVDVLQAVIYILVAKISHRSVPPAWRDIYRRYANSPHVLRAAETVRRTRGRKITASAQGNVYDLEKMFTRLNQKYFDAKLEKPILTWSQRRTRRILGHNN
ncbi:MAG: M48 family peptidase, partial [Pyrinomonadaceae bacterium]